MPKAPTARMLFIERMRRERKTPTTPPGKEKCRGVGRNNKCRKVDMRE